MKQNSDADLNENHVDILHKHQATDFPIGDLIQIEYKGKKYSSILRGVFVQNYFFVDCPTTDKGKSKSFYSGVPVTVRFIAEGAVYGFLSYVLKALPRPKLLLLEYPKKIEKLELRKEGRLYVFIPARIAIESRPETFPGAVLSLSRNGARLIFQKKPVKDLTIGRKIKLSMVLPSSKQVPSLIGELRHLHSTSTKLVAGIRLHTDESQSLDAVRGFFKLCFSFSGDAIQHVKAIGGRSIFALGQEINLEIDGKIIKFSLRGWKNGKGGYIVVEKPTYKDMANHPKLGAKAIARFQKDGIAYGFMVSFALPIAASGLWIFLFQDDIVESSLRMDERFNCMIPALLKSGEAGKVQGMLCNISMNGVKILAKDPLDKDKLLLLSFFLSNAGSIESQKIKILREYQTGKCHAYAGSFLAMTPENNKKLLSFIEFCKEWRI